MNRTLERALDQVTTKRLEILRAAIAVGTEEIVEKAAKGVVIIGTKTATGSLVYMANRTMDTKVQAILIQQIAAHSPLRQEYKSQLLEIIPGTSRLAQLYAVYDHALTTKPVWHERAETFDERRIEDTRWLDQALEV